LEVFLKQAKKLLPYIDIGEANRVMARAMKTKGKKGQTSPLDKGLAYKIRQVFSTGKNPVLALFPNFMHDHRRQGGLIVEDPFVPLFPYFPRNKSDGRPQALWEGGGGLRKGQPIVQNFRPTLSKARDEVRARQPGGRGSPDAPGESALEEHVTCRLGGGTTELAGRVVRPTTFGQAISKTSKRIQSKRYI
jgi:hypothetical protein